jgi:AcrR family transcriptional regulator
LTSTDQAGTDGALDARVVRSRRAVLAAGAELLRSGGVDAVTVEAVTATSGVAKTTVYRHWPTRDHLLAAVVESCLPRLAPPAAGATFRQALDGLVDDVTALTADQHWRWIFPALAQLRGSTEVLAGVDEVATAQQMEVFRAVFALGVEEGALPQDALGRPDVTAMLLVGPLVTAAMSRDEPIDPALAARAREQFLAGQALRLRS